MKVGIRKPSIKRSLKARTTGRAKRALKRSINPFYGKRGMGFLLHPLKAAYGWVYRRVTVSVSWLLHKIFGRPKKSNRPRSGR